jgi:ech hydrogenase subunit A
MGMFIAPFGMIIAKWATLISFADQKQVALVILLVFGSAATFMFWAKWLGKLSGIAGNPANKEVKVHKSEWISIGLMAVLFVGSCLLLPLVSQFVVEPYIATLFGGSFDPLVSSSSLWIATIAVLVVVGIIFFGLGKGKGKKVPIYLSGISADNQNRTFHSSLSKETEATSRNWYLENIFGENIISPVGTCATIIVIALAFVVGAFSAGIF